jgi:tetratricopeptide (TPR) repeat protein
VLEVSPCHLDALKGRARSKRSVGNSRGAEADLREALRCGPGDEEAAGLLSDLLADHGDLEGAQKVAAEEFSGPEVEKRLGDAALAAGQPGSAAAHYRKALEAGETAETLRALGEAERQRGDDMAALDAHRRASRLDREGTGDLYWIGVLASRLGYRDEAKNAFDAILAKQPADSGARVGKARILRSEGDREGALRLVEDVLRDDPENGEALVLRGQLLSSMGRTEAARDDFRTELARHPDDGDARILLDRLPDRRAWGLEGTYDRARVVEGLEDRDFGVIPARVEYLSHGVRGDLRWTLGPTVALVTEISIRREAVFNLGGLNGPSGTRDAIYDFDVLGATAGLDHTLSDLWTLSWRVGASRYNPRLEGTIASETHPEGNARLERDDGRTRLGFAAGRSSFIWRGYATSTQFRIFERDSLSADWERSPISTTGTCRCTSPAASTGSAGATAHPPTTGTTRSPRGS